MTDAALAPGVPPDYYDRIAEVENRHWWHLGMRKITESLLGELLERPGQRLLDAGCGTGGFLRWALDRGAFASAAGIDIAATAIELARRCVPEADLRIGPLRELPFADGAFDLAVTTDVIQHVPIDELDISLSELYRVLAPGGTLLVRTNGARRRRDERHDWRAFDRSGLSAALEEAGFSCERVTYANALLSLLAAPSRRTPHAPSESSHGLPEVRSGRLRSAVGLRVLSAEARWLARPGRTLPFGHTLFAVATRPA